MRRKSLSFLLYIIIFLTGAAGLICQVTWQKYLSRLMGADTVATAIILANFLGGLSLGYYLCGKFTLRIRNQIKAYAVLQGIIGVWCLYFPTIFKGIEALTHSWSFSPPLIIIFQGFFSCALLMGIPTICMGGTIPLLTRGIAENVEEATSVHATVYSINTAGAFLGTLIAGFYLVPIHGLPLTIILAAFMNLGACIFLYGIGSTKIHTEAAKGMPEIGGENEKPTLSSATVYPSYCLYSIVFLSGFYVMMLENVFIRITNLSLGSSSYSFSMIVAVFILSIAIGSYIVGRLKELPKRLLFFNQLFITLLLLLIYMSLDTWPYWAHLIRITFQSNIMGFWGYYTYIFLILTVILIFPVGFMGATVPIAFHELKRDLKNVGKHSGILFSWNTLGNLSGSLLGGIVLYYFFNNARVFLIAVLFAACTTLLAGLYISRKYFFSAIVTTLVVILFTISAPFFKPTNLVIGTFRNRKLTEFSLNGPGMFFKKFLSKGKLKFYKDGPTCSVGVVESCKNPSFDQHSVSLMVNGKSDSSTIADTYTLKLSAHIPSLLAKSRKNIMVIGLGTGVTAAELTLYPDVEHIDIAEISPTVIEALPYFQEFIYDLQHDPRVQIHLGDAFRILGRSKKKWDIIISEPSNPWVTGVDLLFTQEFYKLAKEHLTNNGILVQWVQIYATSPSILGMILNTIQHEFKQSRIFIANSSDILIIASNNNFSIEDLNRAEEILNTCTRVKNSLGMININSIDAILLREIWPPSYIVDQFSEFGIQTMDNPRLHYLAGKRFFIGEDIPWEYFFNPASVPYFHEFLLIQKYKNWAESECSGEKFLSLLVSTWDKVERQFLPMADTLKLKAYLDHSDLFPLSNEEKERLGVYLLPFILNHPKEKKAWRRIGLEDASYKERAQKLLDHIQKFRTWINPYPLDGLKSLLQEGILLGKDAYERNWCILQLVKILSDERTDNQLAQKILNQIARDHNGEILLMEQDEYLLNNVFDPSVTTAF